MIFPKNRDAKVRKSSRRASLPERRKAQTQSTRRRRRTSQTRESGEHAPLGIYTPASSGQPPQWCMETARTMLISSNLRTRELALEGLRKWHLDRKDELVFREMLSLSGAPNGLASNMELRIEAGKALIDYLVAVHEKHPHRRFYHLTFIDDRARTKDRLTEIDAAPLKDRVRKLMEQCRISNWVAVVELEGHTNAKRGSGRAIVPHVHLLTWTARKLKVRKLERALCRSKRLMSDTRAKTVKVSRRQSEPGEIAHAAAYLLKGPIVGKNLMVRRDDPQRHAQRDTSLPKSLAIRLVEILSQLNLSELVFSSGSGKRAREAILSVIRQETKRRSASAPLTPSDAAVHWLQCRKRAGKTSYAPVLVKRKRKTS